MKVLIIEDEPLAAERLKMLLHHFDPSVQVEDVIDNVEDAVEFFNTRPHPDLLFLDIELADGISFGIFSKVQVHCPVIFATAYDQYAIEAFRLFSIDYLLKPVTAEAIARAVNKYRAVTQSAVLSKEVLDMIQASHKPHPGYKNRFLLKTGTRMFFKDTSDVAYFYAVDKTVYLVTKDGNRHTIDYTLEKLQELLDPAEFFRLNRSIICSVTSIKEIKTHFNSRLKIALKAGAQTDEAIVSRDRVQAFKAWAEL